MIVPRFRWPLLRRRPLDPPHSPLTAWRLASWLLAGVLLSTSASAQQPSPPPSAQTSPGKAPPEGTALPAGTASPAGPVGIDRLLKLPDSLDYGFERRGGATRNEWRSRFDDARKSLSDAQAALDAAQAALADHAGESQAWSVAPPGLPAEAADGGGDTHRLREEVRRQRAELDRAQARLRDLEIQANLAGVPEDWRGSSSTGAEPGHESVPDVAAPQ